LFTELLFYAVLIGMAYLTMQIVRPFLAPLAWAAILAMSLRPIYLRFRVRLAKTNAALVTTLLAGLLIITPAVFLTAIIVQQTPAALAYVNGLSDTTPAQILTLWASLTARVPVPLPPDPMALIAEGARNAATFLVGGAGSLVANVLGTLALVILAPLAAGLLQMALSRSREYEADRRGAQLIGSGEPLARALEKLDRGTRLVPSSVDPVQAGAYIANPFNGQRRQFAKLFTTHPPMDDRIARLRGGAWQ